VEGEFDYTLIEGHLGNAHKNNVRLVILWFWKPEKQTVGLCARMGENALGPFPRMMGEDGEISIDKVKVFRKY